MSLCLTLECCCVFARLRGGESRGSWNSQCERVTSVCFRNEIVVGIPLFWITAWMHTSVRFTVPLSAGV